MKTRKASPGAPDNTAEARTKGEATRDLILTAAARAIRERGPGGVSVVEVMREAGLTHGGFYAHFASKEALVAAAIQRMFARGREKFLARIGDRAGPEALKYWIDSYVSRDHRDNPGTGCAVAALASDMPRLDASARDAYDAGLRGLTERIARHLPATAEQPDQAACSLLAEMAGAVALARAVSDPTLSDRLLKTSRASLKARIDQMSAQ